MFDRNKIIHIGGMAIALGTLWLLLSGHYTPFMLSLAVVSIVLVIFISLRMKLVKYDQPDVFRQVVRLIPYSFWLIKEILKSNIDVIKRIINPELPISPRIIWVKSSQKNDLARVVYANSITLTPGTISIDVDGNDIEVHALSVNGAEDLKEGEMDKKITQVEA